MWFSCVPALRLPLRGSQKGKLAQASQRASQSNPLLPRSSKRTVVQLDENSTDACQRSADALKQPQARATWVLQYSSGSICKCYLHAHCSDGCELICFRDALLVMCCQVWQSFRKTITPKRRRSAIITSCGRKCVTCRAEPHSSETGILQGLAKRFYIFLVEQVVSFIDFNVP